MKNSILFLVVLFFSTSPIFSQIAYPGLSFLLHSDLETNRLDYLAAHTGRTEQVAYDPIREVVYWNNLSIADSRMLRMDKDGGNLVLDLLDLAELNQTNWFHDFENQEIYYFDGGANFSSIHKMKIDPNPSTIILDNIEYPFGIDVDLQGEWIYWTDNNANTLNRVKLDGSGQEELIKSTSGLSDFAGVALDLSNQKLYYVDKGRNIIYRTDMDGSNSEELLTNLDDPENIALYAPGDQLVWTSLGTNTIQTATLNGENKQTLIGTEISLPHSLFIDQTSGDLYWTDNGTFSQKVERVRANSLERDILHTGYDGFETIFHDPHDQKIYLTSVIDGRIMRMNYDGSSPEVVTNKQIIAGRHRLAVDGFHDLLYFVSADSIVRMDLQNGVEKGIVKRDGGVRHLELDMNQDRLYWSLANGHFGYTDLILQTNTTVIATENVGIFALDHTNGKVFYEHTTEDQIRKMNFDATDIEPIVTAVPRDLALDVPNNRLYWSANDIFYSDLDGLSPTNAVNAIFKEFIVLGASGGNLLLNGFVGTGQGTSASLEWTLDSDFANGLNNNESFIVERQAAEKIRWEPITDLTTNTGQSNYSYMDDTAPAALNKYRIRYVHPKGQVLYSPTILVDLSVGNKEPLAVAKAEVDLLVQADYLQVSALPGQVELFSIDGKAFGQYEVLATPTQIPITHLEAGLYVLHYISSKGEKYSETFIRMER